MNVAAIVSSVLFAVALFLMAWAIFNADVRGWFLDLAFKAGLLSALFALVAK